MNLFSFVNFCIIAFNFSFCTCVLTLSTKKDHFDALQLIFAIAT